MSSTEKGSAVNPTGQRNPNASRSSALQRRLYALISVLVLTLALIAILEYINRSLPNGSQTGYSAPLRVRDLDPPDEPAVLARRSYSGSTNFFIPASTTVTIAAATCTAPALSCACPSDVEIPNCNCSPDAAATVCTCSVQLDPSCGCDPATDPNCACANPYIRDCVCPPDSKCSSCQCPGAGSYYETCECPPIPEAAGCSSLSLEEASCGDNSPDCGCSVFQRWSCGYQVALANCSAPAPTVSGVAMTVATIYPVSALVTSSVAPSSSSALVTSSVAPSSSPALVTSSIAPSSSSVYLSSQAPQVSSSSLNPLPNSSPPVNTPPAAPATTSALIPLMASSSAAEPPAASPPATTPAPAPLVASPSAAKPPAASPPATTAAPIPLVASPSVAESPAASPPASALAPVPLVVSPSAAQPPAASPPATTAAPIPLVASSSAAKSPAASSPPAPSSPKVTSFVSSLAAPIAAATSSVTSLSPVLAIIAPGVATSPLAPGVILLVSSTVVPAASGQAPSRLAQVTFLRTTPAPSVSVITGPSGTVYTIPTILLAANPVTTPTDQATSPISPGSATPAAPAAPLAPVTSPALPSATAVGPGASALPLPLPVGGTLPNPAPSAPGASAPSPSPGGILPNPSASAVGASVPPSEPFVGGALSSINLLASVSSAGSLPQGSSGAVVGVSPSVKASGVTASGSASPSNAPPSAAPALNGATSVSGGGGGGGGGGTTSGPSPTPSATSGPVTVAIYSWPVSRTVLGGYIPIIVARLFHGGWTAIYSHINRHETVSGLFTDTGASGSVLFGTGLTLWYAWPAYVAVWSISPFASEVIYFDTNYGCANPNLDSPANPCWPPIMSVNLWVSRVLQALLALVAVTVVVLVALWFKKPSSSDGDPTSIAAVAAIMGHPEVEREFKEFDADTSTKELKTRLKNKKYRLSTYQTAANIERYGIVPVPNEAENADSAKPKGDRAPTVVSRVKMKLNFITKWTSNWKSFQMRSDIVFMLYLFAVISAIIVYLSHINDMDDIHLFDGSNVGRRLLFAILACLISSYWARLQRDAQTLAPYADLAYPNLAPPRPTILFSKRSLAIVALYPLLRYRHFFAALTAFTAVLSEFLVVSLSGMPYRPGQLRSEFLFCSIASLTIIAIMIVMLIVINFWRTLAVPHLPRKPDNMAAVMTYVCNSSMNKDFEGLERDRKERDRHITELRKKYRYGVRRDADGKERWAVDEVAADQDMAG